MEVVFGMPFLLLSNADIWFAEIFGGVPQCRGHAFWPPPGGSSSLINGNLRPPHLIKTMRWLGFTSYCLWGLTQTQRLYPLLRGLGLRQVQCWWTTVPISPMPPLPNLRPYFFKYTRSFKPPGRKFMSY